VSSRFEKVRMRTLLVKADDVIKPLDAQSGCHQTSTSTSNSTPPR
jgi:hypothetical protein